MGEYSESLYPNLDESKNYTILDLKNKLSLSRIKDFENDLFFIKDKINHYKKIHKRWNRIDSSIKITQIVVSAGIGIAGVILIAPIGIPLATIGIPVLTGAISVLPVIGTINSSVIRTRKERYEKLIKKLEAVKNKLFLFQQKAVNDEVLTDDELSISKNMVNEVHEIISGNKKVIIKDQSLHKMLEDQTKVINEMKVKLGI